jgi:hypothetical protein
LKAAREKHQVAYKGKSIRITEDFSAKPLNARRLWNDVFKFVTEKNLLNKITISSKAIL